MSHGQAGKLFGDLLVIRVPHGLRDALATASRQRHMTASEYSRRALFGRLHEDGISLPTDAKPSHSHDEAAR